MSRRPARRSGTEHGSQDPAWRPAGDAGGAVGAGGVAPGGAADVDVQEPHSSGTTLVGEAERLDHLLYPSEVATALGVSIRHVRRLVLERRLPYVKLGKFVRFDPADVRDFVARSKVAANTAGRHDGGTLSRR